MVSIEVPDNYGYVLLACGVLPAITNSILSMKVMKARKKYDVKYPNLYATPGYHKEADSFNRVQRGHQNMFESISDFRVCSLVGGLKYPLVVSVCGLMYSAGAYLYMAGYSDNSKDVKMARHTKGGPMKLLAYLTVIPCAAIAAVSLLK